MVIITKSVPLYGGEEVIEEVEELTPKQIEYCKKYHVDIERARLFYGTRHLDQYRVSKGEVNALKEGERFAQDEQTEGNEQIDLTDNEKAYGEKYNNNPLKC